MDWLIWLLILVIGAYLTVGLILTIYSAEMFYDFTARGKGKWYVIAFVFLEVLLVLILPTTFIISIALETKDRYPLFN